MTRVTFANGVHGAHGRYRSRPPGRAGALSVTRCGEAALVLLIGDLGTREVDLLRCRLADVVGAGPLHIVVDASAATSLDAPVLDVVEEIAVAARAAGGGLEVVDAPSALEPRLRHRGIPARTTPLRGVGR